MNEEELIEQVAQESSTDKYTESQRENLVKECWNMLEKEVQDIYLANKKEVDNKVLNGLNDFSRSMQRLQNSFSPNNMQEALESFRNLDKCNHSTENSIFSENIKTEINKSKVLSKVTGLAQSIQTQLSTLTSEPMNDDDQKDLERVAANLLEGIITTKSILSTRSIDEKKVRSDKNSSSIHPSLTIAIGKYAKENISSLKNLNPQGVKLIATKLKAACSDINLDPKMPNANKSYLVSLAGAFKKVDLNMEIARLQAKKTSYQIRDRVNSSDSSTTVSLSPTNQNSKGKGFFR